MKSWGVSVITPPAFYENVRHLEISLSPDFPMLLFCANYDLEELESRHDVYDFHWLRLDRFSNLRSVKIWIAARSITCRLDSNNQFIGIKQLTAEALRKTFAPFKKVESFTLSTPLGSSVGPEEDGIVQDVSELGFSIYKRGTGDKFHPFLNRINPGDIFDGLIHTYPKRHACTIPPKVAKIIS